MNIKRQILSVLVVSAALCSVPAHSDVLGLNDYPTIFTEEAENVTVLGNGSEAVQLPGGVQVLRDGPAITTLDQSNLGAVGCFVRILAQLEAYQTSCDAPFDAAQMDLHASYLEQVLRFYAANSRPVSSYESATVAYDALVDASVDNAGRYCTVEADVEAFFASVLLETTQSAVDAMISQPRLPADNPCL